MDGVPSNGKGVNPIPAPGAGKGCKIPLIRDETSQTSTTAFKKNAITAERAAGIIIRFAERSTKLAVEILSFGPGRMGTQAKGVISDPNSLFVSGKVNTEGFATMTAPRGGDSGSAGAVEVRHIQPTDGS